MLDFLPKSVSLWADANPYTFFALSVVGLMVVITVWPKIWDKLH